MMVSQYGQEIINDIEKYSANPKQLCTLLHLCTADSKPAVLNNFLKMKKVIVDKVKEYIFIHKRSIFICTSWCACVVFVWWL